MGPRSIQQVLTTRIRKEYTLFPVSRKVRQIAIVDEKDDPKSLFFIFLIVHASKYAPNMTSMNFLNFSLKSDAAAAEGEAGIFEQLSMGLLMVERQEPAGTCPSIRLALLQCFIPLSCFWRFVCGSGYLN
jgi:hypothetical protein